MKTGNTHTAKHRYSATFLWLFCLSTKRVFVVEMPTVWQVVFYLASDRTLGMKGMSVKEIRTTLGFNIDNLI